MVDPSLERLAGSENYADRVEAARIAARADGGANDAIVLRLLCDARDTAVPQAMAESLVEARGEAAISLLLRALGADIPADADDHGHQEAAEYTLNGLSRLWVEGVDVDAALTTTLLEAPSPQELIGALVAIQHYGSINFRRRSDAVRARLRELIAQSEYEIRALAWYALEELEPRANDPFVDSHARTIEGDKPVDRALDRFYAAQTSDERLQAQVGLAQLGDARTSGIVQRWFQGPNDPPPPDSVARVLFGPHPEQRAPLILRALGQSGSGTHFEEFREFVLERLLRDWLTGSADALGAVSAALETRHRDHDEVLGALLAIAHLAPHREMTLPEHALEYIALLSDAPEHSRTQQLASAAQDALSGRNSRLEPDDPRTEGASE
jgi:hypothetical protein